MGDPSWGIFGRQTLKGRMTMLDDPRDVIGAALKYLGYSLNTTNENEISRAEKVVVKWKENLAKFDSQQFQNGLANGEYLVSQGFTGELILVTSENPNLVAILPREGTIIAIDTMVIPKDAQKTDLAYAFINFMLDPQNALETTIHARYLTPNTMVYDKLPEAMRNNPLMFPSKAILDKSELIKNLGKDNELYYQAWERVKATE